MGVGEVLLIVLWVLLGILGGIVALGFLWLLFAWICSLFVNPNKEYEKNSKFYRFLYDVTLWLALVITRVKIHVEGMDKLPKDTRFVLVSNHVSNYDALVTTRVFRKYDMAVISKPSNFNTFIFGRVVRRCCYLPIDRENARNAVKTINKAGEMMKADEVSVLVYPEGTRNKAAKGLLPFHNSVFKIAHKAGSPIVVMSVRNTERVHKRAPFRRTHVYLTVLDVFSAEEVMEMRTADIGEKVQAILLQDEEEHLQANRK